MRRAVAAALGLLALVAAGCGGSEEDGEEALAVVARVALPETPGGVAVDGETVWATVPERGELVRIGAGGEEGRFRVARALLAVAVAEGSVWAADPVDDAVVRVHPGGEVLARIPVHAPGELVAGLGAVWATEAAPSTIVRIDPATNRVVARIPAEGAQSLTVGAGSVWGTTREGILRIDPATNRVAARIPTENWLAGRLAASDAAVWAANPRENAVVRIDPARNEVLGQVVLPRGRAAPAALAAANSSLWVAGAANVLGPVALVRIDERTNRIGAGLRVTRREGPLPGGPAAAGTGAVLVDRGTVWVLDPTSDTLVRIGRRG